jgi:hypothetical protein
LGSAARIILGRIVICKLKPWADEFIMLRMELYYQEFGDVTEGTEGYEKALEKEDCNELLGCCNPLPHRNAVESQARKGVVFEGKNSMRNRICSGKKRGGVDLKRGMLAVGRMGVA